MAIYLIPSKKDIENYLNDYETEGISKESLSICVDYAIKIFQTAYPIFNLAFFFSFSNRENIDYKTFIRNIIPFLVLNDICRVYYVDYDGNPFYEGFPNSKTNQDKELFFILNHNPDFPEQSIDKEMFESSYTRLDKNGNYVPVKI